MHKISEQDRGVSRRRLLQGAVASAAMIGMPFVSSVRAQGVPTIRYATGGGIGPNEMETVIYLEWMQKNVLKHYGKEYVVDMTLTRGTPEAATLLAAGQADMATLSFAVFANTILKKAVPSGIKAVADNYQEGHEGYAASTYYALESSGIRTVADLKGKKIAINAYGSATDLVLRVRLNKEGIDPKKDVQIVEVGFANIAAAIREKRVDCGVLILPFMNTEVSKGGLRAIFSGRDVFKEYSPIFQVATGDFLQKSPQAARAFLADYVQGLQWFYDPANRKKAVEITADFTKSPADVLDSYFLTPKDYFRDAQACITPGLIQRPIDAMQSQGLIATPIKVAEYMDMSYLPFPCSKT